MIALFAMIGLALAVVNFELDIIFLESKFRNKNTDTPEVWDKISTDGRYD